MENNVRKNIKISNAGRKPSIKFGSELEDTIFNIVSIHNKRYPKKKVNLDVAKEVVKRGMDVAIKNNINDIISCGLTRLRMFIAKKNGQISLRYNDDDLLKK